MSAFRRTPSLAFFVALTVPIVLASCDEQKDEPSPVRPVLSVVIEPVSNRIFGPFAGSVEPRYKTDLGFRTSGRMVSRNFNVGDRVAKGALLASLDPRLVELALASSKADLANARAQLVNATATQQRQSALLQSGSTPQSQVDSAVASQDTAQAKVNQAEAALTKAKEQLDYTSMRSDFDGVITNWNLEVGQVVSTGQTVVTLARPDIRDAVFDVPDELVARVQQDKTFSVALQADASVTAQGMVREIAPQADAATQTRRVRLTLEEASEVFRLGTTVTIVLKAGTLPTVTIPASAILEKDGKTSVWLATQDGKAARKPVVLGERNGDTLVVTEGLAKGDRVIIAGAHSLSDGQSIKVEPES